MPKPATALPPALLPRAGRQPFIPEDCQELLELSLDERRAGRLAELDRATGRVDLPVPPLPPTVSAGGARQWRRQSSISPAPDAAGGTIRPVRAGWVAKYDPHRAEREEHLPPTQRLVAASDVLRDFSWGDPAVALTESWISTYPRMMRGAGTAVPSMNIGDLVFALRTGWFDAETDPVVLRRRALVGLWWVESFVDYPLVTEAGRRVWVTEVIGFPMRRFDIPVPVVETGDVDAAFASVAALRDRSRLTVMALSDDELLAVTRACALPAQVLTEPDPDQLTPLVEGLRLGPPTHVHQRIVAGACSSAHRRAVEGAGRDAVVAALRSGRFGSVSTEKERGLGSDIWAQAVEADGSLTQVRIEVKGLSGSDPAEAVLTDAELRSAKAAAGDTSWWLAVVVRALRADRKLIWVGAADVATIWTEPGEHGRWRANRQQARARGL